MELLYTYWKDEDMFLGHLDAYPQYDTQGETLAELEESLIEIYSFIEDGTLVVKERKGVLQIAK